jgi:DUF4097 and DUF4098 domain-containing protein YvlB
MRRGLFFAGALLCAVSLSARAQEQTEHFSRKVKIGPDGRVTVSNIAGLIAVTAGSGDEVAIDAVKHTNGDKSELRRVQIEVSERPDRVDVRTNHDSSRNHVWVDYTIVVPTSASVELHSVSGELRVANVKGAVRAQTVSGAVTAVDLDRLEFAKTVSGDVSITGVSDGDLNVDSVSGRITAANVKTRGLTATTVSGAVSLKDVACERLSTRSVSGDVEYVGTLAPTGRYEFNSHSGTVRVQLPAAVGFELDADSFSGAIRSEFPMTLGGDANADIRGSGRRGRSLRATYGDGKATLMVRTFSGDVLLVKR